MAVGRSLYCGFKPALQSWSLTKLTGVDPRDLDAPQEPACAWRRQFYRDITGGGAYGEARNP